MPYAGQTVSVVQRVTALRSPNKVATTPSPSVSATCASPVSRRFDDLTDTIFAGHHQPLRVWILCLYFMGLNLSNHQMAKELDLNQSDVHQMTGQLRQGIVAKKPSPTLTTRWNVTRSTSWLATKASLMRWQKRAARTAQTAQGQAGTGHARHREAADLRDDPAWW